MSQQAVYAALGVRGYEHRSIRLGEGSVVVRLGVKDRDVRCPGCGSNDVVRRGCEIREFRAPPIAHRCVSLLIDVPRVACEACGTVRQVAVTGMAEGHRCTRSFVRYVLELRKVMTIRDLAIHLGVSEWLVRTIEKEYLHKHFAKPRLKETTKIAIDELSIGGGHRYLTIVLDLASGAILFVGDGKGASALAPFWRRLKASRATIDAVAMDMSAAYVFAVTEHLPGATIVFDKFHVVKLMNEKLSDLRRELHREATDRLDKQVLKGTRWLLMKNPEHLDDERNESVRLQEALELNHPLATAYYLKEDLRQLWSQKAKATARKFLDRWIRRATSSGIRILQQLAKTLQAHRHGLLSWYDFRISTGPLEGINNKVRTLQRTAYGYRDQEYFRLKLHALHTTRYALIG
jgi:transposase